MLAFARGAFAAALVLLSSVPTIAADKQFHRNDLADAAIVAALAATDPTEIEPQCGQSLPGAGLGGRDDDGAVHVTPVAGVGMAQNDAGRAPVRQGQGPLQGPAGSKGNGYGLFGYHPAERIAVGGGSVQRSC